MKIVINQYNNVDFLLLQGDNFSPEVEFYLEICDDLPADLTGWTVFFEIRDHFLVAILIKNAFSLLPSDTIGLHPTNYTYQLTLIDPLGVRYTPLFGNFHIKFNNI